MFRKFSFRLALLAVCAATAAANNVIVLPTFSGGATANALVFTGSPLSQVATFETSTESYLVLTRPTTNAADVKYYVVGRSGSGTVRILNSSFAPIGQPLNLGQNATAAAITPDGRRFLVVAGNLRIYNTETDQEIQAGFLDVGLNPEDIAVSYDSRRAFVMSSGGQRVTVIDLTTNAVAGNIALPGLPPGAGFISAGPNGMIYVSAADRVLEIDPRGTGEIGSANIRRQFPFPNARVGKLHFTPDGTRALAVNHAPQSGQVLFYFSLDFRGSNTTSISSNEPDLQGFVFDKVFIGENSRAYLTTTATSARPRKLFAFTLPDAPAPGAALPPPALIKADGSTEAFFGSLGNIPIVDSIAFSGERPNAGRMFVQAPLNVLTGSAPNTLYVVNLSNTNVTGQIPLNFLPGGVFFAGPAATAPGGDPASGILRVNAGQPTLAVSGRSLPFGVQVIGTTGQPLFNFPVTFTTISPGASLEGASSANSAVTVNTNAQGFAFMTVTAPASAGDISVTATAGGFSTAFPFSVGGTTPGGGDPGPGPGQGGLKVISGNGLAALEGEPARRPIIVELRDAAGNPVVNAQVVWTITQGQGNLETGTLTDQERQRITTTDAQGRTENTFRGAIVFDQSVFATSIITVSSGGATQDVYAVTLRRLTPDGNFAPLPSVAYHAPTNEPLSVTGKTGQTVVGAIRVQVSTASFPQTGLPIPNLGVSVRVPGAEGQPDNDPTTGPVASCAPNGEALTNEQGIATCDLMISGRVGSRPMLLEVGGGAITQRTILLQALPGDPSRLRITNGNNQSGNANENLLAPLTVILDDGGGNVLAGQSINWSVIGGSATLANSSTITNAAGQATNTVRLGTVPGPIQIRATAVGGTQPSVTFNASLNVTVTGLVKISGDNQTAFTNTNFTQPIVVEVRDTRNLAVAGQTVTFSVTGGSATLTAASAVTDSTGRALTQVRAGANAGPIVVTAAVTGIPPVTFNLTAQLPGPVINALDVFNAASGERGAVVPGGIYLMVGQGLAPELRGCITANTVIGPWPTRLNGVEIQFGSTLAPLLNVCNVNNRQSVAFQAPTDLAPGGTAAAIVRVGAGSSTINGIQVIDLQPGIFETTDGQGRSYVVAIRPNGTYVTPENPARYGEVIRIYITGAGPVTPAFATGSTGVPNQNIVAGVVVGLNDAGVRLVSATYAEGATGLYEIAFEVPQGTATGANRPLGVLLVRSNGQFVFPGNSPVIAIAP